MRRLLCIPMFMLATFSAAHAAAQLDFNSTAGATAACSSLRGKQMVKGVREQQALVICRDLDLVRHVVTFVRTGLKKRERDRMTDQAVSLAIREELLYVRDELAITRRVLEQLRLRKKSDGLTLTPAKWVFDMDGDDHIDKWETRLFAIQPRQQQAPADPTYVASFIVDQSDIQWALGYHYFAEALVEMVLSYRLDGETYNGSNIALADPAGMERAHKLLMDGLKSSDRLRVMLLAETDDDREWIANPRQRHNVFPLPLDDEDFAIWETVMKHALPLIGGETLLTSGSAQGGLFASVARMCPPGQGLSIPRLFSSPPPNPLRFVSGEAPPGVCQQIDAAHPRSELIDLMEKYAARGRGNGVNGVSVLSRLLWVN
jgi:hypothetical protein